MRKFPEKLRNLIAERRLSQEIVAREPNVHQTQVGKRVHGKNMPYIETGHTSLEVPRVPQDYLADEHDE